MKKSITIKGVTYPLEITMGAVEDLIWEKELSMTDLGGFFSSMSMKTFAELILQSIKISQEQAGQPCELTLQDIRSAVRTEGVSLFNYMDQLMTVVEQVKSADGASDGGGKKGNAKSA